MQDCCGLPESCFGRSISFAGPPIARREVAHEFMGERKGQYVTRMETVAASHACLHVSGGPLFGSANKTDIQRKRSRADRSLLQPFDRYAGARVVGPIGVSAGSRE